MKTLFLTLSLIAIAIFAKAQIAKGKHMIGCNFNFSKSKTQTFDSSGTRPMSEEISTNTGYNLRYGYLITDHIMIGLSASLNTNNSLTELTNYAGYVSVYDRHSNLFSAGMFARYYKMLGKSKFSAFGQLGVNYNQGESKSRYIYTGSVSESNDKNSGISGSLNLGLNYFLTKNIALETSLANIDFTNYKMSSSSNGIKNREQTTFQFTSNTIFSLSSLNIGINFYFGGKKKEAEPSITTPQ
jgi:opacity protein-like surface antigen